MKAPDWCLDATLCARPLLGCSMHNYEWTGNEWSAGMASTFEPAVFPAQQQTVQHQQHRRYSRATSGPPQLVHCHKRKRMGGVRRTNHLFCCFRRVLELGQQQQLILHVSNLAPGGSACDENLLLHMFFEWSRWQTKALFVMAASWK